VPGISWGDRWASWRNGLVADPRFQRWAADFPLTRAIAHRRTRDLFDLVAGFVYSQTLASCARLRLLETLRAGPRATPDLAASLGLPEEPMARLLGAAEAVGLLERAADGRHRLAAPGAALLGNPGLTEMIAHHDRLYADLGDPVGLLRREGGGGKLAAYWPYATSGAPQGASADEVGAYSALMAATLPGTAADVFAAYPIARHRVLLDVGGGEGAFLALAGAAAPRLGLMLMDLPAVTDRARRHLACARLAGRAEIVAGDFLADPVPPGADLVTLIRILHDHDDAGVSRLLASVRAALPKDGALLIAEPMSAAPRRDRVCDAYFAMYLLAMGRGRARTPDEIMGFCRAAGFRRTRALRTRSPALLRAVLAQP
jgi:demethylspheroidene O-methyltransferase